MPGTVGATMDAVGKESDPFTIPPLPLPLPLPPPVIAIFEFVLTELPPFELDVPAIILAFIEITELPVPLFKLSPVTVLPPLELLELIVLAPPKLAFVFKEIGLVLIVPPELFNPFVFCELPPDIFSELDEVDAVEEVDVEVVEVEEAEEVVDDDPVFDEVGFFINWLRSRLYFL